MKKNIGIRSALFTLVIITSIASYVYLNLVNIEDTQIEATPLYQSEEELTKENNEVLLPDVEIVKTIIQKGLDLIPNS